MDDKELKNIVYSFAEYLKENGISFVILAKGSDRFFSSITRDDHLAENVAVAFKENKTLKNVMNKAVLIHASENGGKIEIEE